MTLNDLDFGSPREDRDDKLNLFNDFNSYIQDINGQLVNAGSRIVKILTDADVKNNIYDQAARMSDIADEYAAEFRQYAEAAERYAERATSRGSEEGRRAWESTAQQFNDWADSRATQSAESWLESTRLSSIGDLGKYAGPVGDIIDTAKVAGYATVEDWDGVGQASASILGGILGVTAGLTIMAAFFPSAPVIVVAGAAALAGHLGGIVIGEYIWPAIKNGIENLLDPSVDDGFFEGIWSFFNPDNPFDNPLISPLIIDLDGDGVELTSLGNSQTHFDLDGNGFAQRTGWVTGDDAFLAIDRNGDGKINDINELFGNANTDGFTELSELDTNNDGVIDANDAAFASLMLWQDRDGDGVTDEGELISLADAGIASIDLQATAIDETNNGHDVSHRSRVMMDDGSERTIDDVWFANDRSDTQRIAGDDEAPAGGLASEGIPYLCSLAQITDLQNASIGTLCGIKLTSYRRNAFKMHGVVS